MPQAKRPRIGILTLPFNGNYGGMIQAVALTHFLLQHGGTAVVIRKLPWRVWYKRPVIQLLQRLPFQDYNGWRSESLWMQPFEEELRPLIPHQTRKTHSTGKLRRLARGFDAVIVGSDQVWREEFHCDRQFLNYFLDFVPDGTRRISYAASFGHGKWPLPDLIAPIRALLARFDSVSVREESGVTICQETFGHSGARQVLDPTLLMPAAFYDGLIAGAAKEKTHGRAMLLTYLLDETPASAALEERLIENSGGRLAPRPLRNGEVGGQRGITIAHWLAAFRDADYVLTDSFHGMVFAIIHRKNFYAFGNRRRGLDRFTSLLSGLGLEDRLILDGDSLPDPQPIDYDKVLPRLDALRAESASFLLSATGLDAGVPPMPPSDIDQKPESAGSSSR